MGIGHLIAKPLRAVQGWAAAVADRVDAPASRSASSALVPARARERPRPREPVELRLLLRQLSHWRPSVRARAARLIGVRGALEATEDLVRLSKESRREVRLAALVALLRVSPSRFVASSMELSRGMKPAELLADLDAVVETIGAVRDGTR